MQLLMGSYPGYATSDKCDILTIWVHQADRMWVGLHPTDRDATVVLGPSEGGLGGLDNLEAFPASGCNAYPSGVNVFFC